MVERPKGPLDVPVRRVLDDVAPQPRQEVGLVHLFDETATGSEGGTEGVEHVVEFVKGHGAQLVDGQAVCHVEDVEVHLVGVDFEVVHVRVKRQRSLVQPLEEDLEQSRLFFR